MQFDHFLKRPEVLAGGAQMQAQFSAALAERCRPGRHGDLPAWLQILEDLPSLETTHCDLTADAVSIGRREEITDAQHAALESGLRALSPWRKGPYNLFGTHIDCEWRSDWKWQRLTPYIRPLVNRRVLDVGCGTGYHCWRMLGAGAASVLGIDPSMRFLVQYLAIQKYAKDQRFDFLPLGIEDMPRDWPVFDSVFSMGVLYHRRNPINHLRELFQLLKEGGELILETLIVDEAENGLLRPQGRYAMMRNVWSIMTVAALLEFLRESGFVNVRCVDQNITSLEEQRRTPWMQFHSLEQFLDPNDHSKTIEGHPAPKRGIFVAEKL